MLLLRVLLFLTWLLALFCNAAVAQDDRRVVSPDGQLEFHLFVNTQEESNLSRVAYQVRYRGQVLIDTSFLGFDLYGQEPLLGENVGLVRSSGAQSFPTYQTITGHYMQNGSLGRLLDVEVRVYNDGVAFRYVIGKSAATERLLIADEATEFDLPHDISAALTVPFITPGKSGGWVAITEVPLPGFPRLQLGHEDPGGKILLVRLTRPVGPAQLPDVVYDGKPPLTSPWRVVIVGAHRAQLLRSGILTSLRE